MLTGLSVEQQVADGDKAGEKIARDREAQRGTVAALSRDIAAVKQREEAASSGSKGKGMKGGGSGSGGLAQLSEAKAAVRVCFWFLQILRVHFKVLFLSGLRKPGYFFLFFKDIRLWFDLH